MRCGPLCHQASTTLWIARNDLRPTKVEHRQRKLNWDALRQDIEAHPDAQLSEQAERFGVTASAIQYALKRMKIKQKKALRHRERSHQARIKNFQVLRERIKQYGAESLVYIDKTGFEQMQSCLYAGAKRGKKVHGDRQGKRSRRTNLVAARRKQQKDLLAPMRFTGRLDAVGFEE